MDNYKANKVVVYFEEREEDVIAKRNTEVSRMLAMLGVTHTGIP